MQPEQLARSDINLLLTLAVLLEELSVTRTATRLCLSQSAVSKALAKLREQFSDPLFVRSARGLKPTAKARALQPKLDLLVKQLANLNEPDIFDPHSSQRRYTIALVESAYPLILPHFLPSLFYQGTSLTISTHNWGAESMAALQSGEFDLGITGRDVAGGGKHNINAVPAGICGKEIYRDHQMCLVRRDHPCLADSWDLDNFLKQRHVQVRCDGSERWLLDYHLAELGLQRDIAIVVPDFNHAANLCSYTDVVFTAPSHFTSLMTKQFNLVQLELPIPLPSMAYTLFWHQDKHDDQALQWLINLVLSKTEHLR
jgi:DNA-binding transcriptional LysR family regulator